MSAELDQVRLMAERISRRVTDGGVAPSASAPAQDTEGAGGLGDELAAVRAGLEELRKRLVQIESHVAPGTAAKQRGQEAAPVHAERAPAGARSPWLSGIYVPAAHPSQEKFKVEEAAVSELVDFFEGEKKCELEPGGKPCDHCAMCSTRGF